MKTVFVLALTIAVVALQNALGRRNWKLAGAVILTIFFAAFVWLFWREPSLGSVLTGLGSVAGTTAAWMYGRDSARKAERQQLDRMAARDL